MVDSLAKPIGARWVGSSGRQHLICMKLDPVKVA